MKDNILRFTTAWSVDNGKSTLIWRLLFDSKSIFEDQYSSIEKTSKKRGSQDVDLALLTDGLKSEIEQWITIDVAYRYFYTPKRKFIIADTPWHIEYTRNMITWASNSNLALILIDARHGVIEQTYRHTYIANLLGIKHVVFCINKMDLVDYDEKIYNEVKNQIETIAWKLNFKDVNYLPISALYGDNIVNESKNMPWYKGLTLISMLEDVNIKDDYDNEKTRYPVQYVIRPKNDDFHDYRWYAWRIVAWKLSVWDDVKVLPSWNTSKVKSINLYKDFLDETENLKSYSICLEDDIDISRWSMIVKQDFLPTVASNINIDVCWLNQKPLNKTAKYEIKHTTNHTRCMIQSINHKININTYETIQYDDNVNINDIANIDIKLLNPIFFDAYKDNQYTWSLIIIDENTNETVWVWFIR